MAQEWEGELLKVPIKKILFYSGMVLLGLVVVFLVCRVLLNLDALGNTVRGIFGSLRAIVLRDGLPSLSSYPFFRAVSSIP